jgi:hypothetical protein
MIKIFNREKTPEEWTGSYLSCGNFECGDTRLFFQRDGDFAGIAAGLGQ